MILWRGQGGTYTFLGECPSLCELRTEKEHFGGRGRRQAKREAKASTDRVGPVNEIQHSVRGEGLWPSWPPAMCSRDHSWPSLSWEKTQVVFPKVALES